MQGAFRAKPSAGHIAMGVSAMGDESQEGLLSVIPLQQNRTIKIIETSRTK